MAPLTADMEKIMARCGEDEACIEREVAAYGFAMGNNPAVESARKDVAEVSKQGAPRYQIWTATLQKGTYSIEESAHIVDSDPICMSLPGRAARATRRERAAATSPCRPARNPTPPRRRGPRRSKSIPPARR